MRSTVSCVLTLIAPLLVQCSSEHAAGHAGGNSVSPSSTPIPAVDYDALFVVNGGDASLTVINTETNEARETIRLHNASFPHHVYLSTDRTRLALAVPGMDLSAGHGGSGGGHSMKGAVALMDAPTGATIAARVLDQMNHNASFGPGGEIWTSQMVTPGAVIVLDPASLETKRSIPVGNQPAEVTFSTDGKNAFVANTGSASVTVVDTATKTVVKTIDVGQNPVGAWQGSNGIAYVDNETPMSLSAIDTNTLEVKLTYSLGFMPGMAALGPDGNVWVTDSSNGKVVLFMPDQDVKVGEIAAGAGAHGIAFSGDRKTAYVSNQEAGTVSAIDVATRGVSAIAVGAKPNGMVWRAK